MRKPDTIFDYDGTAFPAVLAFSSAYTEVACFIGLLGLFTSFVTGNMILVGVELVQPSPEIVTKILVLLLFIVACALWSWAFRDVARPSRRAIRAALYVEFILLGAAVLLGWLLGPLVALDAPATFVVAAPVVLASSLQLIMMRHQIIAHPHTTVMTGNIGHLAIAIATVVFSHASEGEQTQDRRPMRRQAAIVAGFIGGALCGGFAFAATGFFSLLLPMAILLLFAALGRLSGGR